MVCPTVWLSFSKYIISHIGGQPWFNYVLLPNLLYKV